MIRRIRRIVSACTAFFLAPAMAPPRSPLALLETLPGTSSARRRAGESRSSWLSYHTPRNALVAYMPITQPTIKDQILFKIPLHMSRGMIASEAPRTTACTRSVTITTQRIGGGVTVSKNSAIGFALVEWLKVYSTPFSKAQMAWAVTRSAPMSRNSDSRHARRLTRRCCEMKLTTLNMKENAATLHNEFCLGSAPRSQAARLTTSSFVPASEDLQLKQYVASKSSANNEYIHAMRTQQARAAAAMLLKMRSPTRNLLGAATGSSASGC
mmetsp:Transcript_4591/g.8403  ORF Transcript_4591/g.8403 Transcript_4591/m.8403 type:complete len:269 (+) Transcript_4591:177-983(+)